MHPSGCKCHFDCGLPHQSWTGGGWKGCFVWSFEHREGRNWMLPHFCSNQLLRSCHDRRQTIISLFNDNYFCQCYLQLLDDVYYHRYLQLIIMMIIIIIFFKCLFWLLINTRRIETYHLWILSLIMNCPGPKLACGSSAKMHTGDPIVWPHGVSKLVVVFTIATRWVQPVSFVVK